MEEKNSALSTIFMKELSKEELLEIKGGYDPWAEDNPWTGGD